jgi:hypothetical protein
MADVIKKWREATEEVARAFVEKYYPKSSYDDDDDCHWVADEVGSIFSIADMFFDVDRMIQAIELNATFDQLYDYADGELEHAEKQIAMPINFKNYVKYGKKENIII